MQPFSLQKMTKGVMHLFVLAVLLLPFIQTDTDFNCNDAIKDAVSKMSSFVRPKNSIYHLFPYIEDPDGQGRIQTVCRLYRELQSELKHNIYPRCEASYADSHLVRIAGYEHICGNGLKDYGQFGKCIYESASKLETCKMKQSTLETIKWEANYGSRDEKENLCADLHKYIQCSTARIEKACGSSRAGQWYKSFITYVFKEIDHYHLLGCSFGGIHFPMWAYFVVAAGVLLLLWCTCRWLHVSGLDARACSFIFGDRCLSADSDKSKGKDRRSKSDESIPSYTKGLEIDNLDMIVQMRDPPLSEESLYPTVNEHSRKESKYGNGHIGRSERVTVHCDAM